MTKTRSEHALSVIKAAISAVPCVGGAIASLIGDYVPTHTEKSIEDALRILQSRLASMEDRLDVEAVDRDEFAETFKSSYLTIMRTHQQEKLRAAVAIITNLLLRKDDPMKLPYTELDHFTRCLDALSTGAIRVLAECVDVVDERTKNSQLGGRERIEFGDLRSRLASTDDDLLMGLVGELNSCNLLHIRQLPSVTRGDDPYGNYPLLVTGLGQRFVKHLLS